MSLHMPDLVRSIRTYQESLASIQAWWLASKQVPPVTPPVECPQLCTMPQSGDITREISAAMGDTLPNNYHASAIGNLIKTSESHPIK